MRSFLFFFALTFLITVSGFARADNGEIISPIEVSKTGSGPDILLIPGLSSSADVWTATTAHLQDRYTVHVVQVKGFAGTPADPGMENEGLLDKLTQALSDYIQANHLEQPVVIGHSMGGYLTLRLQRDHPAQISKAVIVDALPFYSAILKPGATAENMKPVAAGFKAQILAGAKQDLETRRTGQRQILTRLVINEAALDTITEWALDSDAKIVGQVVSEMMTSDLRGDLSTMSTPTLVLTAWAKGGPYTSDQTRGFWQFQYQGHPDVTVVVVPGSRHFIMFDQPDEFLSQVDAFLAVKSK